MKKKTVTFLIVSLLAGGCATIVSKSDWPIRIATSPEQAEVTVVDVGDGRKVFTGKTPTTLTLSSKGGYFTGRTYNVEVSKEGYATQSVEIRSSLNGWYFGNILFGGLIGFLIVDPLTGAMWTLEPADVTIPLGQKRADLQSDHAEFSLVLLQNVPDHLRSKMVPIN